MYNEMLQYFIPQTSMGVVISSIHLKMSGTWRSV